MGRKARPGWRPPARLAYCRAKPKSSHALSQNCSLTPCACSGGWGFRKGGLRSRQPRRTLAAAPLAVAAGPAPAPSPRAAAAGSSPAPAPAAGCVASHWGHTQASKASMRGANNGSRPSPAPAPAAGCAGRRSKRRWGRRGRPAPPAPRTARRQSTGGEGEQGVGMGGGGALARSPGLAAASPARLRRWPAHAACDAHAHRLPSLPALLPNGPHRPARKVAHAHLVQPGLVLGGRVLRRSGRARGEGGAAVSTAERQGGHVPAAAAAAVPRRCQCAHYACPCRAGPAAAASLSQAVDATPPGCGTGRPTAPR